METVYLLLGSNLGNREANLRLCLQRLSAMGKITAVSCLYQTKAWGKTDQPDFYNQAVALLTKDSPEKMLNHILALERELGRTRHEKWGSRIIDVDILLFGGKIIESGKLNVPHPQLPSRRFALTPLAEIAPDVIHPVLKKSIADILADCTDPLEVTRLHTEI